MKTAWWVLASLSLLCGALSGWLLFTAGAGAGMLAGAQLFIAGAVVSVACACISALLVDQRKRLISVALLAGYGLALLAFLAGIGNVR